MMALDEAHIAILSKTTGADVDELVKKYCVDSFSMLGQDVELAICQLGIAIDVSRASLSHADFAGLLKSLLATAYCMGMRAYTLEQKYAH